MQALHFTTPHKQLARELILILPRLRANPRPPLPRFSPSRAPSAIAPIRPHLPGPSLGNTAPTPASPSLDAIRGFGRALNDCAPENYNNLSVGEKAHCVPPGAGVAIQEAPNLMGSPSQVKDEAHWREELAREQSPVLLPCGLNVICLLGKLADGSLSDFGDPRTWPHYEVKQIPPEDFYKIQKAYDAWHAEHGAAQKQQK